MGIDCIHEKSFIQHRFQNPKTELMCIDELKLGKIMDSSTLLIKIKARV